MKHLLRNTVALVALAALASACGDMAGPVDGPNEVRTAEQELDFEQGLDFERVEPALGTVHRCQACESMHILHLKTDASDDKRKGGRSLADEVADGNPVPFPVDEKNPTID